MLVYFVHLFFFLIALMCEFFPAGEKITDIHVESPTFTVAWNPKKHLLAYACDDNDRHSGSVKLFGISNDT